MAIVIKQKDEIIELLKSNGEQKYQLFKEAHDMRNHLLGNVVQLRGLIEISNHCRKNCLYCGIRLGNRSLSRYRLSDDEIIQAARFAYENRFGSIVLQGGEEHGLSYTKRVTELIDKILKACNNNLKITLSFGEQDRKTYSRWRDAGAYRYLLRVETTNSDLYREIHPNNKQHSFESRIEALKTIKDLGYVTGSGVMIGLPNQTIDDLANDLMFFKEFNLDMVGMGPYIEHNETPLYRTTKSLLPIKERLELSYLMIATLRLMMPHINIAASTALQAIDPHGREFALKIGANVIMPNITPTDNRVNYQLYNNKPAINESSNESLANMEKAILASGCKINFVDMY